MKRIGLALLSVVLLCAIAHAEPNQAPLLLQNPTMNTAEIAFAYGDAIWVVSRNGGTARRLVGGPGLLSGPIFSPDGKWIAYTSNVGGNRDVYVVAADGGQPRRLTYHPDPDIALGWTPDSTRVLFSSDRFSYSDPTQFYTVPITGGFPTELPLMMANEGTFSPDGKQMAYVPNGQWEPDWKSYHGGQTTPIWIVNLATLNLTKIPRQNSNDKDPMWVGNTIYFLSDRSGPVSLFAYDTRTNQVREIVHNTGLDLKSASAGPGGIVYEQFGSLHIYDFKSGREHAVNVRIDADLPQLQPHFEKITPREILNANISPTGQRAVFEAHGEILTVPAEKGDVRDITRSSGVADRDPAWSPDGKWIAYFSDRSGEYALHLKDQSGLGEVRSIDLGKPPSFFFHPIWSPDSKKIVYTDKRLNLWYVDLDHPTPVKIATDIYALSDYAPAWSPDSRWIAYGKVLTNRLHAICVYSLSSGQSTQITDGMSDALDPQFDKSGKYLFFTASTNTGLTQGAGDMTSFARPVTRSVYVVVLRKDLPSPLAPESDDEKAQTQPATGAEKGKAGEKQAAEKTPPKPPEVRIDFANIGQRILALPIPDERYISLAAGKAGVIYLVEAPVVTFEAGPQRLTLIKFDLKTRKTERMIEGIRDFYLSFDGNKMLYQRGESWFIASAAQPPKPGEGALKMSDIEIHVNPRAEWDQMYHEVWRIERDFFYSPQYHGLDLAKAEQGYAIYLPGIASRGDLNYLFREMTGNMTVGHMFVRGGVEPSGESVSVGLLGADYTIENNRYRITRVFSGENWNPELHAPLTQPGVDVTTGEYLLAVNGRELHGTDNLYSFFLNTAGKQVVLTVGPNPNETGSRQVTVVPVASERALRNLAWIEGNRRLVDKMTGGRIAYVYLPDTSGPGYTNFNRYYFAQVGKQGVIVDERFNHGGFLADYIIDYLRRQPMSRLHTREGEDQTEPFQAIYGPKVMLINQYSGSGGDALPWYFRKANLGPLIGVRTWGGLVGIPAVPRLIDGGMVTSPSLGIYGLDGHWEVENHGIPPSPGYEVEQDPKAMHEGHDPQLDKAIAVVMQMLKANPPKKYVRPPFHVYHHPLPTVPH
jgi:tricorn protease